jgi:hypothetical protein
MNDTDKNICNSPNKSHLSIKKIYQDRTQRFVFLQIVMLYKNKQDETISMLTSRKKMINEQN